MKPGQSLLAPISGTPVMAGSGISWLWPLVDGAPPIGWDEASRYLVLPVLLVVAQFVSSAIITPPPDPEDESAKRTQVWVVIVYSREAVWASFAGRVLESV